MVRLLKKGIPQSALWVWRSECEQALASNDAGRQAVTRLHLASCSFFKTDIGSQKRSCEPLHTHDFVPRAATMCRVSASAEPLACLGI
jgi:hypothetical protein